VRGEMVGVFRACYNCQQEYGVRRVGNEVMRAEMKHQFRKPESMRGVRVRKMATGQRGTSELPAGPAERVV